MIHQEKMNYVKYNGCFYQHRSNDGRLFFIDVMGKGKEVIVIRHLYHSSIKSYKNSLDIRYFTKVNGYPTVYNRTRDGIQIKNYLNYVSWVGDVIKKIVDGYETIVSFENGKDINLSKYRKKYKYLDIMGGINR